MGTFRSNLRTDNSHQAFKQARKAQNLTQAQLGELSGISERRIEKFESGERGPSLDERCVLAEILGTTESTLLLYPERGVM